MKITIELTEEDIRNGKLAEIGELLANPAINGIKAVPSPIPFTGPDPVKQESMGMYSEKGGAEKPSEDDILISMGEGIFRELVALWLDPELEGTDRGIEINNLSCTPHTKKSIMAFVRNMATLPHAVDYVRIKWGGKPEDWRDSEDIAMNITQIASVTGFPELAELYHETFKWENQDENYKKYRSMKSNV